LRHVRDLLLAGRCCLWLLPDSIVACGDADALMRSVTADLIEAGVDVRAVPAAVGVGGPLVRDRFEPSRNAAAGPNNARPGTEASPFGGLEPKRFLTADLVKGSISDQVVDRSSPLMRRLTLAEQHPSAADRLDPLASVAAENAVTVVRAWLEPSPNEVASLARRFPAQAQAAPQVPRRLAGRLLVAARARDLPPGLIAELERDPAMEVRWWWGIVGRADTAMIVLDQRPVSLGTHRDRLQQRLTVESIVELAGPDLALAMDLATSWNGWRNTLEAVLRKLVSSTCSGTAWSLPAAMLANQPTDVLRPPTRLLEGWADGSVTLWEEGLSLGSLHGLDSVTLSSEIDRRMWVAQLRILLPAIETARRRLSSELLADGVAPNVAELELGLLRRNAVLGVLRLNSQQKSRLDDLVACRNLLAHNKALPDVTLRRVYSALI